MGIPQQPCVFRRCRPSIPVMSSTHLSVTSPIGLTRMVKGEGCSSIGASSWCRVTLISILTMQRLMLLPCGTDQFSDVGCYSVVADVGSTTAVRTDIRTDDLVQILWSK